MKITHVKAQTFLALTLASTARAFAFIPRAAITTSVVPTSIRSTAPRSLGIRRMSATPIEFAKAEIANNKVVVFSKSFCPFCKKTKALLDQKEVNFVVYELDEMENGAEIQDALLEISGQKTVPNVFINGQHLGGNSETQEANKTGKLDEMLAAAAN